MRREHAHRALGQLLNSASSAVFSLGLVAATDDGGLGAIAIQMTALPLLLGVARTAVFEGLLFRTADDDRRRAAWLPAATGLAAGLLAAVCAIGLGALVDVPGATALAIAAVSFTVIVFDGLRFSSFALDRAQLAMAADLAWLALTLVSTVALSIRGELGAARLAWAYTASGLVGCCLFVPVIRRLRFSRVDASLRSEVRFGVDFVLQIAPGQTALVVAALVADLDAVGIIRAAATLFSPLATVIYAARLILIDRAGSTDRLRRAPGIYALAAGTYTALLVGAFSSLPALTTEPLGELPLLILAMVGVGEASRHVTQSYVDRLRQRGLMRPTVALRTVQALLLIAGTAVLGWLIDVEGLALARVIAFAGPLLWWLIVRRNPARPQPSLATK